MARIEPIPMDQADGKARALLDELVQHGGEPGPMVRAMANAPTLLRGGYGPPRTTRRRDECRLARASYVSQLLAGRSLHLNGRRQSTRSHTTACRTARALPHRCPPHRQGRRTRSKRGAREEPAAFAATTGFLIRSGSRPPTRSGAVEEPRRRKAPRSTRRQATASDLGTSEPALASPCPSRSQRPAAHASSTPAGRPARGDVSATFGAHS